MDKEKQQNWTLVIELMSAIAVVVTLAIVVIEMRSNTSATRAQTYQLLMQEMNDYRSLFTEPGMAAIATKLRQHGWVNLEPVEQRQLYAAAEIRWGFYESAYYANKRGVLGQSEWHRFERAFCRAISEPSGVWNREGYTPMNELLTAEFSDYVDATCN
jgi:hypothetical protein